MFPLNDSKVIESLALKSAACLLNQRDSRSNKDRALTLDSEPLDELDRDPCLACPSRQFIDDAPFPAPNPVKYFDNVFVLIVAKRERARRRAE
jgi:hypothetical protein